jgi:hypothetical protein
MTTRLISASKHGRLIGSAAGVFRPLKIATMGTSHMTAQYGFGWALMYALAKTRNADVVFYSRSVLTSVGDPTVIANPGQCYATPTAGSSHTSGAQLTQFLADVATGKTADILFTDGGLYNDAPTTQANLQTAFDRTVTVITAFLDATPTTGNAGMAVGVYGLFDQSPQLCSSWANMWRNYERSSGGRVRFIDVTSVLMDPTNTSGTSWVWRGGEGVFGAATQDGTHVSTRGAEFVAPLIAEFLNGICPKNFMWPGGMNTGTPAPSTLPWINMMGTGSAMIGTGGLLNGTPDANVPGTGAAGLADRWNITTSGGVTVTPTISTATNGEKQLNMALSGTAGLIQLDYQSNMTGINNSVSGRLYSMGCQIDLAGVTGLNYAFLRAMSASTWDTPLGSNANNEASHGLPDTTTETWNMRSLYPVAWTGNNPTFKALFQFRTATLAGTIKVRNPFLALTLEP